MINTLKRILFKNKALVLIYHRVVTLDTDPQLLAVNPENFENHLIFLKQNYNVIPLQQLIRDLKTKNLKKNTVVITFDDGYYDNLKYAKPILKKHSIPATFFIMTGNIGTKKEYWWDELERITSLSSKLPDSFSYSIDNLLFDITSDVINNRTEFYNRIFEKIRNTTHKNRNAILNKLQTWANVPPDGRETHRPLSQQELVNLADSNLIEIGAHTITHPALALETLEEQELEIRGSKKMLETILNKTINSFSYPFGTTAEVTPVTQNIVRESGFLCGIANVQSLCTSDSPLYFIPRRLVRNWNADVFRDKIKEFFNTNI